jgi:hypothetical protein
VQAQARNQLSMSATAGDEGGAADGLPYSAAATTNLDGVGSRTRHQIKLTAQIIFNPKYPFPLSDFTVQVSLTTLQLKRSAGSTIVGRNRSHEYSRILPVIYNHVRINRRRRVD